MLIEQDEFLFPRTFNALATGCVMGICAQWPPLWRNGYQNMLARSISGRLARILNMVLAVEMAEARENGLLKSPSPEGRYEEFDTLLSQRRLQDILLEKYGGLSDLPWTTVSDWSYETDALLRRLSGDTGEIAASLGVGCGLETLKNVTCDCADLHEDGAGVCVLEFHDGIKLVYKSRPMAGDVLFARLVHQLNGELGWQAFRAPASLDMGPYGWQEYIATRSCTSPRDIKLFYRRQGANLALLYLLGGVDFHAENMVAAGDFPLFVDLETLMQPVRGGVHSLVRSGMVPVPGREYDYSALGCTPDPDKRVRGFVWRNRGSDMLRLELAEVPCDGPYCLPLLCGERIEVRGYERIVADSFTEHLHALSRAFTENCDLRDTVAETPIRFIYRTTRVYHEILSASLHPENLRTRSGRREFIETQLAGLGLDTPEELFEHEVSTLERGYIPTCHTQADSTDLWFGNALVPDFFPETALKQLADRVKETPLHAARLTRSLCTALKVQA